MTNAAKRRFSKKQKDAILAYFGPKCAECGADLTDSWEADHIIPFSKGGLTDVLNAQPLCKRCNIKKGDKMSQLSISAWPEYHELRVWQYDALRTYEELQKRDFLAVATPGAGKTFFSLRVAHLRLRAGEAQRIVVVCPTKHLTKQWANAAADIGIDLDPDWANSIHGESEDYHGVALTYQQVASNPELSRIQCRRPTFVIFDEIHHAGESLKWGESLQSAFSQAIARLSISGTPFRTDNNPIPFITYDENNTSIADFTYGYGDSLSDRVCRPIMFPSYEGRIEWFSGAEFVEATFRDEIEKRKENERLNMAISASSKGNWLREFIAEATKKLKIIRTEEQPDAGGLIIARDMAHARAISRLLNEKHVVVVSDDRDASDKISKFKNSKMPWIIAVKMVSEGIDIPRLRVGVYATNITTELFFRQVVGRFVRWQDDIENQIAYLYIPRDHRLVYYAQTIKDERDHQIFEENERAKRRLEIERREYQLRLMTLISSEAERDDVIFDQEIYSEQYLEHIRNTMERIGMPSTVDPVMMAKFLKFHDSQAEITVPTKPKKRDIATAKYEKKKRQRALINRLVRRIAYLKQENGLSGEIGDICRGVYTEINSLSGEYIPLEQATLEQLIDMTDFLLDWKNEIEGKNAYHGREYLD